LDKLSASIAIELVITFIYTLAVAKTIAQTKSRYIFFRAKKSLTLSCKALIYLAPPDELEPPT
jgi:hypothetical protein